MSLEFSADFDMAGAMLGAVQGVADAIKTSTYIKDLTKGVQHELGGRFNEYVYALAASDHSKFHHVFEWGQVGLPAGRLWQNIYAGASAKRMISSFEFLPSKTQVPLPDYPPSKSGKQLHRRHIFWNKAFVMEYNIPVVITPQEAKVLFIPQGTGFTFSGRSYVTNPGGQGTTGSFTATFVDFYNNIAPNIFRDEIKPRVEKSTEGFVLASGRKSSATRVGMRATMKEFATHYNAARAQVKHAMLIDEARYADSGYDEAFGSVFGRGIE